MRRSRGRYQDRAAVIVVVEYRVAAPPTFSEIEPGVALLSVVEPVAPEGFSRRGSVRAIPFDRPSQEEAVAFLFSGGGTRCACHRRRKQWRIISLLRAVTARSSSIYSQEELAGRGGRRTEGWRDGRSRTPSLLNLVIFNLRIYVLRAVFLRRGGDND